ncbi:MAG: class I SAM-dependent methyltransferase [Nostoc sp. GBBB01]|nr:class I SAM-dependent methyltransferase [Nostoc sp. GBBB01]
MNNVSTSVQILREHYQQLVRTKGDSPGSGQWGSIDESLVRYLELIKIADLNGCRILDIGCSIGYFAEYLQKHNITCQYTGIDIVPEAIEIARHKFPDMKFECLDITQESLKQTYDYVLVSAVFNNYTPNSNLFLQTLIKKAFTLCEKGLAFNFISSYVNFRQETMAYYQPEDVLRFCIEQLSRKVTMIHHYYHCDVCIYIYK